MHAGDSFKNAKPPAWRGTAEVAGKITDEAGKGVPDAKVTFVYTASNDGFFATTKKSGEEARAVSQPRRAICAQQHAIR